MPASRAAGITRRQCYEAALRRDSHDATARAQLEEVRSRLRVTWREKRLDEALTALRDGRAGAGWLIRPEDVLDEPWQVSDAQLRELMRGVRLAGAALERELDEAAIGARDSLERLQFAKHGKNVRALGRARREAEAEAEARDGDSDEAQDAWMPVYLCDELAQPAIEGFADVYSRVRRHESARVRLNDSDRLFLRASKTARALYDNPDNPKVNLPDEAECLQRYRMDLDALRQAAASNGATVAAYDTFAALILEMEHVRRLKREANVAAGAGDDVDFVTQTLLNNPKWQRNNHRGRASAEAVERAGVVLRRGEAARALAGLQPLRVPPLNVLGTENDADPDGPMYPQRQLATLATQRASRCCLASTPPPPRCSRGTSASSGCDRGRGRARAARRAARGDENATRAARTRRRCARRNREAGRAVASSMLDPPSPSSSSYHTPTTLSPSAARTAPPGFSFDELCAKLKVIAARNAALHERCLTRAAARPEPPAAAAPASDNDCACDCKSSAAACPAC